MLKRVWLTLLFIYLAITNLFAYYIKKETALLPSGRYLNAYVITLDKRFNKDKFTIYINATIHGNEPAPHFAVKRFLKDKMFEKYLDKFNFVINPLANPDGFAYNTRRNERGFDLNRDYLTLYNKETQFIVNLLNKYEPDLVIDMHEAKRRKINFLYSVANIKNIDRQRVKLFRRFVIEKFIKDLKKNGYSVDIYTPYNKKVKGGYPSGLILRNYAALKGAYSILFESSTLPFLNFRQKLQLHALDILLSKVYKNLDKLEYKDNKNKNRKDFFVVYRDFYEIEYVLKKHNIFYYKTDKIMKKNGYMYIATSYNIKRYFNDINKNIKVKAKKKNIVIDKGSYIIPLNYRNRALVITLLSPLSRENVMNLSLIHIPLKKKMNYTLPIYYIYTK